MLPDYEDIKNRLGEPLWYDENGVPRYEPFKPEMCGVYDEYIAYILIKCQDCHKEFKVSVSWDRMKAFSFGGSFREQPTFPSKGGAGSFHYGDPPRHDCFGDTMNVESVKVLEFWRRGKPEDKVGWLTFIRVPEYEVDIDPLPEYKV